MRVKEEERKGGDIHDRFCKGHRREVMTDWVSGVTEQLVEF